MNRECTHTLYCTSSIHILFDPSRGNIVYYVFMWLIYTGWDNMFHRKSITGKKVGKTQVIWKIREWKKIIITLNWFFGSSIGIYI